MTNWIWRPARRGSSSTVVTADKNGLRDTIGLLGHGKFHRLRVGIGHPGHKDRVVPWVLGRAGREDDAAIGTAIDAAIDVLPLAMEGHFSEAMKRLHTSRDA